MPGATLEDWKVVIEEITSIYRDDARYKIRILYKDGEREFTYKNRRGSSGFWGLSTARSWGSSILGWLRDPEYVKSLLARGEK